MIRKTVPRLSEKDHAQSKELKRDDDWTNLIALLSESVRLGHPAGVARETATNLLVMAGLDQQLRRCGDW
jgi:hypothetical protein